MEKRKQMLPRQVDIMQPTDHCDICPATSHRVPPNIQPTGVCFASRIATPCTLECIPPSMQPFFADFAE